MEWFRIACFVLWYARTLVPDCLVLDRDVALGSPFLGQGSLLGFSGFLSSGQGSCLGAAPYFRSLLEFTMLGFVIWLFHLLTLHSDVRCRGFYLYMGLILSGYNVPHNPYIVKCFCLIFEKIFGTCAGQKPSSCIFSEKPTQKTRARMRRTRVFIDLEAEDLLPDPEDTGNRGPGNGSPPAPARPAAA